MAQRMDVHVMQPSLSQELTPDAPEKSIVQWLIATVGEDPGGDFSPAVAKRLFLALEKQSLERFRELSAHIDPSASAALGRGQAVAG